MHMQKKKKKSGVFQSSITCEHCITCMEIVVKLLVKGSQLGAFCP